MNKQIVCWLMLSAALIRGENWPGFRGPTYQGLSTEKGLPLHWSAISNVLWKTQIPGESWSSPILWNDRMFVTTATDNGQTCRVLSLDRKSGKVLWDKEVFQQHLFAITDGGVATCMKAGTGELVWQERVGGNFSASPVSAEGRIYFLGDNGETTIIEAGPEFKLLAKNPLGEKVQASTGISQGHLFIRTEKNLFCIGGK